jgi:hypothetical protein
MPRHGLPRVMKHYSPTGRRNHGRPLKRLMDWISETGTGQQVAQVHDIYDDDDSYDRVEDGCMECHKLFCGWFRVSRD